MLQKTVTVVNMNGIHCRPSSVIVKEAFKYSSTLGAESAIGAKANLKSMIEFITMALHKDAEVTISADGDDEAEALEKMAELFTTHFDFPER